MSRDRRFLVSSGVFTVVIFFVLNVLLDHVDPTTSVGGAIHLFTKITASLTAFVIIVMVISAFVHSYQNRKFRWTWIIGLTLFVGAYLYGFFVASREKPIGSAG